MKLPTALSMFHLSDSQWPAPMSHIEQCQRVSKSIWNAQTWHIHLTALSEQAHKYGNIHWLQTT